MVLLLYELLFLFLILISFKVQGLLHSLHVGLLDLAVLLKLVDFVDQLLYMLVFALSLLPMFELLKFLLLLQADDVLLVQLIFLQFGPQLIDVFLLPIRPFHLCSLIVQHLQQYALQLVRLHFNLI